MRSHLGYLRRRNRLGRFIKPAYAFPNKMNVLTEQIDIVNTSTGNFIWLRRVSITSKRSLKSATWRGENRSESDPRKFELVIALINARANAPIEKARDEFQKRNDDGRGGRTRK